MIRGRDCGKQFSCFECSYFHTSNAAKFWTTYQVRAAMTAEPKKTRQIKYCIRSQSLSSVFYDVLRERHMPQDGQLGSSPPSGFMAQRPFGVLRADLIQNVGAIAVPGCSSDSWECGLYQVLCAVSLWGTRGSEPRLAKFADSRTSPDKR